jgi:hypothetical protein
MPSLVSPPTPETIDRAALPEGKHSLPAVIVADSAADLLKPANVGSWETPALRYDPEAIEAHYRRRPLTVLARLWAIAMPFLMLTVNLWWDRQTGQSYRKAGATGRAGSQNYYQAGACVYQSWTGPFHPTGSGAALISRRNGEAARPAAAIFK